MISFKRYWKRILAILSVVACLIVYWSIDNSPDVSPTLVAKVADRPITVAAFSRQMIQRGGGYLGQFTDNTQKLALLDEMIQQETLFVAAKKAGYDKDPEIIATLERIMANKLREDQLTPQLKKITVTDAEIKHYYQQNHQKYTTPAMSRIAVIKFDRPANSRTDIQAKVMSQAEATLRQAQKLSVTVKGFGSLAAQHSNDQSSRYIGGDIGWLIAGKHTRFPGQEFARGVNALTKEGQISPVISASDALYLIKLMDIRAQKTKDISTVSPTIKSTLFKQKRIAVKSAWLASLQDDTPITIYQSVVVSVPVPQGSKARNQQTQPPGVPND